MAFVSDNFNLPPPTSEVQVLNINWFQKKPDGDDEGKDFNLTFYWHVMPKTGKMFADKVVMRVYRLPKAYR
ncbi:hypothetical protein BUALT_Bualt09G0013500 [Buddleja alternifolia]|uniref:Uncharacterized protein n=1 Tax=Buddleja alternifolia TaxID=168488 RepID=A0AAV6X9Z4_9LAMI|nr:hypothetical protein BUALT_Bualt09G0013500 [Buddleja alternifolia]